MGGGTLGTPVAGLVPGEKVSDSVLTRMIRSGPEVWRKTRGAVVHLEIMQGRLYNSEIHGVQVNNRQQIHPNLSTSTLASIIRLVRCFPIHQVRGLSYQIFLTPKPKLGQRSHAGGVRPNEGNRQTRKQLHTP